MHARVILKAINWCNDGIYRQYKKSLVALVTSMPLQVSNATHGTLLKFSFLFLTVCICSTTKQHVQRCQRVAVVMAVKNNQPV